MAKIVCISEENHGFIGVATTHKAGMRWLIEADWVSQGTEVYKGAEEWESIEELARPTHGENWEDWVFEQFEKDRENFLENMGFQMWEEELYDEEGEVE